MNLFTVAFGAILMAASSMSSPTADSNLNPIILVPGDGGSQLEARLNSKKYKPHFQCSSSTDYWFSLWLSVEELIPFNIDCWADNMRLLYNRTSRTTRNNLGVQVRVPGFGNTSTVEFLDPAYQSVSGYFSGYVARLTKLGYKRGKDIFGAPYDFRLAANEQFEYFANLKQLAENAYETNGQKPVIFLTHSMGSIMTLYFLNHQEQAWKDKYVRAFISTAGVWGGTVRALKVFSVGDNLGYWLLSASALRVEQRSSPSLAWLLPSSKLWQEDEILVQSEIGENITVNNMDDFFAAYNYTDFSYMHQDTKNLVHELTPPEVETFCLHGSGVPTTEQLAYHKMANGSPVLKKGDGDGTVNARSLMACTQWDSQMNHKFHHRVFDNTDHLQILSNAEATEYIKQVVEAINKGTPTPSEMQQRPEINFF